LQHTQLASLFSPLRADHALVQGVHIRHENYGKDCSSDETSIPNWRSYHVLPMPSSGKRVNELWHSHTEQRHVCPNQW
jgi:hypothetical protein